jgi:S-DNA-T family DNA segregation ATPase FtsK/SpoIIIE
MHVFLAGDVSVSLDALESAGGWFGWLVGQPLVSSISPVGALITLSAVALLGLMLASGRSLPELARMFTGSVGRIDDAMRTYREGGREGGRDDNDGDDPDDGDEEGSDGPSFYDHAQYDAEDGDDDGEVDDEEADASEEKPRPRRRRQRAADTPPAAPARSTPVRGEQQQMPLGPAAQPSSWSLPPMDMLVLSSNKRAIES